MFAEGVATMHGGLVTGNTAADTGGGILTVNVLTLDNTRVVGNTPDDCVC
jgi:predicted outer membrane repeat protein